MTNPAPVSDLQAHTIPAKGMARDLAQAQARIPAQAGLLAMLEDTRRQSLQQQPAPIAYIDVIYPFPSQLKNPNPFPGIGDPGGFTTAAQLEDR